MNKKIILTSLIILIIACTSSISRAYYGRGGWGFGGGYYGIGLGLGWGYPGWGWGSYWGYPGWYGYWNYPAWGVGYPYYYGNYYDDSRVVEDATYKAMDREEKAIQRKKDAEKRLEDVNLRKNARQNNIKNYPTPSQYRYQIKTIQRP